MRIQYFRCQGAEPEQVVKKAFYLAWLSCKRPEGLGKHQDKPDATEDEVWAQICVFGDYPGRAALDDTETLLGEYHADYVFGRRLKLVLFVEGDIIKCLDYPPEEFIHDPPEYSQEYPTALSLLQQSAELVGARIKCIEDYS